MKLFILIFLSLLTPKVSATNDEIGVNILINGDFESQLRYWQVEHPATWIEGDGVEGSGTLLMNSSYFARDGYTYELSAHECVQFENIRLFYVEAQFRYDSIPQESYGHRLRLTWYEDDNCRQGGQSGSYLEPQVVLGWQKLKKASIRPALNARSVRITIAQNRRFSVRELTFFEHIWVKFIGFFDIQYTPKLAAAYWDNLILMPTHILEPVADDSVLVSRHTLPLGHNYIENGEFNAGVENWEVYSNNEWTIDEGYIQNGAIRTTIESKSGSMGTGVFSQCINFGDHHIFEMGVNFKHDKKSTQKGGGRFRPTWYEKEDCSGRSKMSSTHADPKPISGWQELKVTNLRPPKGAHSVVVSMIQSIQSAGRYSAYWDDVYFKATSE